MSWTRKTSTRYFRIVATLVVYLFTTLPSTQYAFADAADVANGLYVNSEGSPLLHLIQSADTSIDIEIYTMDDASVRSEIRTALTRNVRVRIIKDGEPVGAACKVFAPDSDSDNADCKDQKKFVGDIRASQNGAYVRFNKANLCAEGSGTKCFQHGKMVLVDTKKALISTGNFDPSNLCDLKEKPTHCNRDYSVMTDNIDVVSTLHQIFDHDLLGEKYDIASIITPAAEKKLTVSPISEKPLVDFIKSAHQSIRVENQYLKADRMNQALENAAQGGLDVQVTVSSACDFGTPSASEEDYVTNTFTAFDNAGIKSRMFTKNNLINGHHGYMHAKAIVIDGSRAWVGSVNGSDTSLSHNREFGLFIDQPAWIAKLKQTMDQDFSSNASETWEQSLACAEKN